LTKRSEELILFLVEESEQALKIEFKALNSNNVQARKCILITVLICCCENSEPWIFLISRANIYNRN